MSENSTPAPEGDYTESEVPTFEYVHDRVEKRFATALGASELAEQAPEAAAVEERLAERDRTAREKLDEIRRSLNEG